MTDTATTTATTVWTIDNAHSAVEFAVKHMMFATAKGRFGNVSGTIAIDNENVANSIVDVTIDASSIDTRDEKRDGHLKSADFFDVENHPAITFKSTSVESRGDDLKVTGDLTVRGTTLPVVLNAEFNGQGTNPWGQQVISYSATTKINRKEYGLNWNAALETGGMLVGDDVKITIEIEANA
ncbi:MAG TPA: YceI family protein [Thermomicrobiales bacterium]|nr:YceI family protein [Thermomicrobiales bacterium]